MNIAPAPPNGVASPASAASENTRGADDATLSAEHPFPGLRPFSFADRGFFFGRERQVFALYRLIDAGRFIAVIGSSGSGKSSLVLAGLRGLLAEESADAGGPNWVCLDMRPGASPISRLAAALARLAERDSPDDAARRRDRIEYRLRQSSFSLDSALEEAGGLSGRTLLLVVDQFEELFRFGLAGMGPRRAGLDETRARDEATQFVQILLDADRRRLKDVRILITMRSDFIGDCAYFHGLSEAVSATQYLVPNLTRSQLEEAIRKPIEKAGASIEPELVERLLNDCGDELDQLPVLQHCLMRLWDRPGAEGGGPRRITRKTYDDIGRMSEALSRHADEVLRQCAGKELAVEQAFRALAELDREGRAIRRALRFDRLLAETGAPEADLRAVLARFRAPSCSFIVPPVSVVMKLAPDDRLDIGHEALLRRWKKIAGDADAVDARTGAPTEGWLAKEQIDGQRYRTLVSLLEGQAGGERATLSDPKRTKRWWDSLPRTPAWAGRYGGRFDDVKKLIGDNIAAKQRERRNRVLAALAIVLAVVGGGGLFVKMQIDRARQHQEAIEQGAMTSAKTMLDQVLHALDEGTLSLEGARSLAGVSENFLRDLRKTQTTHAADPLWIDSLNLESDLHERAGDFPKELELASEAKATAKPLAEASPKDSALQQKLYDSTIRVGNAVALARAEKEYLTRALAEYQEAIKIAEALAALKDGETASADVIDAHMKIGDIHELQKDIPGALAEYRAGLSTCEAGLNKFPQSLSMLRNRAKAHLRIAEAQRQQKAWDEAEAEYKLAEQDLAALVKGDPNDPTLKSNLASTYNHWGFLARDKGDLNTGLAKLRQGIAIQEDLIESDPSNPQWQAFAAPNYQATARILEKLDRPIEALEYYQKAFDARRELAVRNPNDVNRLQDFTAAAKALGERSVGLAQIDAYREALRTWKRITDKKAPPAAAKQHYDDVIAMAQVFDAAKDWRDSRTAYLVAGKMAQMNLASAPTDAGWLEKAERARKGAEDAAAALNPPAATPTP